MIKKIWQRCIIRVYYQEKESAVWVYLFQFFFIVKISTFQMTPQQTKSIMSVRAGNLIEPSQMCASKKFCYRSIIQKGKKIDRKKKQTWEKTILFWSSEQSTLKIFRIVKKKTSLRSRMSFIFLYHLYYSNIPLPLKKWRPSIANLLFNFIKFSQKKRR